MTPMLISKRSRRDVDERVMNSVRTGVLSMMTSVGGHRSNQGHSVVDSQVEDLSQSIYDRGGEFLYVI